MANFDKESSIPDPSGITESELAAEGTGESSLFAQLRETFSSGPVRLALTVMVILTLSALFAPWLTHYEPLNIEPAVRLQGSSLAHWLGTDALGRDVYARVLYGGRVSLLIGLAAAFAAIITGLILGVISGYFRLADAIIMRVMDGIMAVPGILLAIALVALSGASIVTVLVAVTIPEIPRVARLARSVMLSVRTEPYVEAAVALGTRVPVIMLRHMMPNALPPLTVQGTYIFASAMLTEATLSFLGAGIPPEIPSWGNIMADGRAYFILLPGIILYPGVMLSLAVLSINILGDALRDGLDPRMSRRL